MTEPRSPSGSEEQQRARLAVRAWAASLKPLLRAATRAIRGGPPGSGVNARRLAVVDAATSHGDARRVLIAACIDALDALENRRTEASRAALAQALAVVGVAEIRPEGEPYDPDAHVARGWETTANQDLDGRVAETESPGYADGSVVLQKPRVVVYRFNV